MNIPVENVAEVFKILSEPNRLRILEVLTTECESVSLIVEATGLSQPLVSHHLRILRDGGLARAERRGSYIYY